jgi:hypothetical protein
MTLQTMDTSTNKAGACSPQSLQQMAWMVANAAYHVPSGDPYQAASRALYQQALREPILELFARSDRQNAHLDASALRCADVAPVKA